MVQLYLLLKPLGHLGFTAVTFLVVLPFTQVIVNFFAAGFTDATTVGVVVGVGVGDAVSEGVGVGVGVGVAVCVATGVGVGVGVATGAFQVKVARFKM